MAEVNPELEKHASVTEETERIPISKMDPDFDIEDDPHRAALEDNPEKPQPLTWSTLLAVMFLGLSFVAPISCGFLLTTSILLPIGTALGSLDNIGWIASSWAVTSAVSMSIGGSVSDIFGRRYIIMMGQSLVIIGAIVGCTAHSVTTVIAASTIVGFGGGLIFVAYAGIPELLPNKWRGAGLGFTELCMTTPWGMLSALIANKLNDASTWRWCYYLSIIYGAVTLIGTALFYFPPSRPRRDYDKSRWQEFKELDFIGITLYAGGLTIFLIGLSWAGEDAHPWKSASVIAPIVLGVVVFVACFAYDWIAKPINPFFPLEIFSMVSEFSISLVALFVAGMVFFSMAATLPQSVQYIYESDPTKIGVFLIPNGAGQVLGGFVLPSLIHKIKYIKYQVIVALIIQTLFTGLYAVGVVPGHAGAFQAFQFFGMMCFAWITLCCYVIAGLHVPHKYLGIASGLVGTFRNSGGAVGSAVFNTIRNSVLDSQLGPRVTKAAIDNGFSSDPAKLKVLAAAVSDYGLGKKDAFDGISGVTPAIIDATAHAFKGAWAYAYQRMFYSTIPFGVIAIITAFFIKDASKYLTNHTAVHMEKNTIDTITHHDHPQTSDEEAHTTGYSAKAASTSSGTA